MSFSSESCRLTPSHLRLSRLGLGCVTFGREIGREAAFAMMDHAVARGLHVFDTAVAYSNGGSETIVGDWLVSRRLEPAALTLATKILPPYSAVRIEADVTASLARLRLESIDLLFLHQWHESALEPTVLGALDALVRSGRVRALGASNFTAGQLARVLGLQETAGLAPIRALQNVHNLAVRGFDDLSLRELCARHDIALVGYSPLGAGFLTGKHRDGVRPGSRFDLVPGHQHVYFNDTARRRLARLEVLAARTGISMPHLALAWALHQPQVATVLVGGRDPRQLDQALAASELDVTALLAELDSE